jgi:diguanylate cyclase (GGDEF)-like protein
LIISIEVYNGLLIQKIKNMFYNHPLLLIADLLLVTLMTIALFFTWRFNKEFLGLKEWFLGFSCALANLLYFLLKPNHFEIISDAILYSLFMATGFFAYIGCRKVNHKSIKSYRLHILAIVLVLFVSIYLNSVGSNDQIGFTLSSALAGLFCIGGSVSLFRHGSAIYPIRAMLSSVLFLHGIFTVLRPILFEKSIEGWLIKSLSIDGFVTILFQQIIFTPLMAISVLLVVNEENLYKLRIQAEHDSLTNLRNRRSFLEQLRKAASLSSRLKTPLAILTIDLDDFKSINDQYGHQAGDEVLKAFCRIAEKCIRGEDGFGRLGGEEFAMYLINTDIPTALTIAERIRATVETSPVEISGKSIYYTTSLGVTKYDAILGIENALGKADHALYEAKRNGRNRTELAAA